MTGIKIVLRQGDITKQADVDAIVNAANTELWMGSGVAGAILDRGGEEIEIDAMRQAPIKLGEAIATSAGNLPNRFVIHAAAMGYRSEDQVVPKKSGSASSSAVIRGATLNSLVLAGSLGCRSLAFPALATGVAGFPVKECADVMVQAVKDYSTAHSDSPLERVVFVLFRSSDYTAFSETLTEGRRS
ncbi:MAG TPA: macro domain-containing protein [Blastocatellia bacterium]|nr:macro domain-containing protein [Blastocatellia bacterium]